MSELEAFSLDPENRAAALAARSVADGSGMPYAPLVIVGSQGSGKTALLHAIADRLQQQSPRATVELLHPATLGSRYRDALVAGEDETFRAGLAAADVVLLDDIERLAGQREIEGLVADLLDQRKAAGREVVVATGTPVEQLTSLDPRVVRRLAEGTAVPLTLPGAEARAALLERRLSRMPNRLPRDVVRALAAARFNSWRDYTGALARLVAFQEASPVALSAADALLLVGVTPPEAVGRSGGQADALQPLQLPARPSDRPTASSDEFEEFLSDVTATVAEQIDRWRRRIGEAVLRYGGEGLRTRRLEALLEQESPEEPEAVLAAYEADATELGALAREVAALAPDLAGAQVLRDPDQLAAARALVAQIRSRTAPLSAPLPEFRWEDLVEGPASRLVMLAGRDIIAEPGRRYSPLLVVGGPGAGKSHYLHAVGNALAARGIAPIACLGAPAFAAELRELVDADALAGWRHRYRWVGAFLLDDLHLLREDRRAQQELAALIGELLEGQRQMVFASVQPLEDLGGFDPRLVSRLSSGLLVELPLPDRPLRLALIKRLLGGSSAADHAALADYLAGRPAQSLREVQAMVRRVRAAALAQQVALSPALAREILEGTSQGTGGRGQGAGPPGAGPPGAGPPPRRGSGILSPGVGLVRSREKIIERWPDIADRLIGELR